MKNTFLHRKKVKKKRKNIYLAVVGVVWQTAIGRLGLVFRWTQSGSRAILFKIEQRLESTPFNFYEI